MVFGGRIGVDPPFAVVPLSCTWKVNDA